MKKIIMMLVVGLGISSVAFSQQGAAEIREAQSQIIALEEAGWQAWKDKDLEWYKKNTTADFLQVFGDGIRNKTMALKQTASECTVKSFELSDFRFVMLNATAVMMTYTAKQSAVCEGKANPPKVQASVNYVKRGGKWLEAFYMETPVTR